MTAAEIAARLEARKVSKGWEAKCPAHEDKRASLSVAEGEKGGVLLCCHAGCELEDIVRAMRLEMADVMPPKEEKVRPQIFCTYDYTDEHGELLFQVVRMVPKDFRQRRPDGKGGWEWRLGDVRRVPYRLADVVAADKRLPVFVPEGEKDVDGMLKLGLVATTNMGGAEAWGKVAAEARQFLAGRHVVALPDNDAPGRTHAEDVCSSLADVAASVRVLELPGLPQKGDVSDWIAAGGTKDKLLEMARRAPAWKPGCADAEPQPKTARFVSATDRLKGERERRQALVARELSYGVTFLDDALGAILPHDLVLIGAGTGAGKTALATIISQSNAIKGKRVYYFALEAEEDEIERRIKYRALVRCQRELGVKDPSSYSYRNWYRGRTELDALGMAGDAEVEKYKTLFTCYRTTSFTLADVERNFVAIQDQADLVVLDHLHYVDPDEGEDENAGYTRIVKRVRDMSLVAGVPVVLIAHLRKKGLHDRGPVRDLDAFHGSSNLVKQVTQAIMLAPGPAGGDERGWPTFVHVPKDRMDGGLSRYVALMSYDPSRGAYDDDYQLGRVVGEEWNPLPDGQLPHWHRSGITERARKRAEAASASARHWEEDRR